MIKFLSLSGLWFRTHAVHVKEQAAGCAFLSTAKNMSG